MMIVIINCTIRTFLIWAIFFYSKEIVIRTDKWKIDTGKKKPEESYPEAAAPAGLIRHTL